MVAEKHNLSGEMAQWVHRTFGHDDDLAVNSQAFRNFIFTNGYCATSLIELMFGNIKYDAQFKIKHGCLWSVFERIFFFVDKRIDKIVKHLQKAAVNGQFMSSDPEKQPKKEGEVVRQSTKGARNVRHESTVPSDVFAVRWTYEVNKVAACTIKMQSNGLALVLETVRVDRYVSFRVLCAACIAFNIHSFPEKLQTAKRPRLTLWTIVVLRQVYTKPSFLLPCDSPVIP
jgi:hypothetical protein